MTSRPRVVIVGFGDTGVLTAIRLGRRFEITGISPKQGLVSGQELGMRITNPTRWSSHYRHDFTAFRGLRGVRTVHGLVSGVDLDARQVTVGDQQIPYDVLVLAPGVRNGFWRRPDVQTMAESEAELSTVRTRLAQADHIAVIGGGAAAINSAAHLALAGHRVTLCFPGPEALASHHPRVWRHVRTRLVDLGVDLRPGHRAVLPERIDDLGTEPVTFSTGQPELRPDLTLWAVGRVVPNTEFLPPTLLDEQGFIRVDPDLRLPGHDTVFAVGDAAATDPLRTSARNKGADLVARNITAFIDRKPLRAYRPPRRRWGSVLGVMPDGMEVFAPNGRPFRFPTWSIETILQPLIVRLGIYRGIRRR